MKNFFKISGITLISSLLFFSCSESSNDETTGSKDLIQTQNKILSTFCDITGSTVVTSGTAIVNPGSTTTYMYVYNGNTPTPTNIAWTVQSANPTGSIIITANGATANVTYAANFISGSISAYGTGDSSAACQAILNIDKSATGCCTYASTLSYTCRGSGATSLSGNLKIRNSNNCTIGVISQR